MSESFEVECTYCDNLDHVYEEIPSSSEPIIVKNYYTCKANVFEVSFTKEELKKYYATCTARIESTRHKFVDELLSEVDTLNVILSQMTGEKIDIIKVDKFIAAELASPCSTQPDFFIKIDFLYNILDLDREPLRKLIKETKPEWKGITLLKQLLKESNQPDYGALNFFEKIIFIRNKTYPAHRFDPDVIRVLHEVGLKYPISEPADWKKNWDVTLRKFINALRSLRKALINVMSNKRNENKG
ncbi:MAG: hypothetical protein QXW39_03445 [Candidatus Bathyarchaeia archaeon]